VVDVAGDAVTEAPFAELKVKLGVQVYEVAPLADKIALPKGQIVADGVAPANAFTTTVLATAIVMTAELVQEAADVPSIV
jgi:hypothetical protein